MRLLGPSGIALIVFELLSLETSSGGVEARLEKLVRQLSLLVVCRLVTCEEDPQAKSILASVFCQQWSPDYPFLLLNLDSFLARADPSEIGPLLFNLKQSSFI